MKTEPSRPQILLDWASIPIRTLLRGVVYVVLLVALGGLVWYVRAARRSSPEELALSDIGRAERLFREAQAAAGSDEKLQRVLESAGKLLASARLSCDRKDYTEARTAAQQSQSFSQKIVEGAGGESFTAKIHTYEGDVKIKRSRQFFWDNVTGNTALRVGDQIKTSSNGSAQIIYFDGTITTLRPGSLLEIRELYEDPQTRVRKVREKLNFGGVSATTPGSSVRGSFHEVATEGAAARAEDRARFDVAYDAETRETRTEVQSGTATVEAAGRSLTLQPRERVEVTHQQEIRRQRVPPSPDLLEPTDQRVFVREERNGAPTALRWGRVEGTARYRLQMARTALFGELLLDKSDIRSTTVQIPGLVDGTYYWRVSAVDGDNVESAFSEARRFKVSGRAESRAEDSVPPPLQVVDFLPSGHLVIINGRTEPGALLSVDGQSVDVYDDGAFTAVVRVKKEGVNEITIVAQDSAGNETRMRRSVYLESF